ncbi:Synaptic vesicle membrane protein VAT-1-like protein [Trichoplax sp. H2]|uniref:Enoyl reductase (ER) domain-containing protein n=1 Tax=Trichoplax adhaerens TaxID=10228 RepID=B3S5J1_TRIAD|nr:expressed hypothetical protein [Trichoplax adhaerens]EDV22049.1 expressed hypothetical protein [Trichoplax adhaerens]RDD41289.1 Synaptic vesicle membrane protein VAT-1-like protein [Trichoplax sp. H2]|eukprot:XP_002115686.1 expressed hypothetical protein [Trichoplax adhaerens]
MQNGHKTSNRCLVLREFGNINKHQIQENPIPEPGEGQIRVKVEACGVNFPDMMAIQGLYCTNPPPPCVLGYEVSGYVDSFGEGVDGVVGARVIALCPRGGWSEYVVADKDFVWLMPEKMTFEDAAAIPVSYLMAYLALFKSGNLQSGQTVLCHIAAGGIGSAVGQLCKTVPKVTLYGTCSEEKNESALKNGYSQLIDYRNKDYVKEIKQMEPDGVDLVLDPLGAGDNKKNYEVVRPFGRQILYGCTTAINGEKRSLIHLAKTFWNSSSKNPMDLMCDSKMIGGVNLQSVFDGHYKGSLSVAMNDILRWYKEGIIKPKIDSVHDFENFAEAFRRIYERKNIGKVVLKPSKSPTTV